METKRCLGLRQFSEPALCRILVSELPLVRLAQTIRESISARDHGPLFRVPLFFYQSSRVVGMYHTPTALRHDS